MIAVTGAAGFIGSNLAGLLNNNGIQDLVLVDDFSNDRKNKNLIHRKFSAKVHRDDFFNWLDLNHRQVEFVFHLGARTNTAEFDKAVFDRLNLNYSIRLWSACLTYNIPVIYASSAATYGLGELGYRDDHDIIPSLKPLNPYGESKNEFDKWVISREKAPPFWAGFKFFNVYGPDEYHKDRMASVVFHAYNQIRRTGMMKLFRSHKPEIPNGGQMRDFIYVKDVTEVLFFMYRNRPYPGIYNLGTGRARTFMDLTNATFSAMKLEPVIAFIDTPEDIRDKYQYFTEAKMEKLRNAGYKAEFHSLEDGVNDYVKNFLTPTPYF
ncbi:MAG TPA: ADP-glyceromanno-heptose 6-epimerase [Bacteroidales bacterium]|nr:ADP-glyceromanno-heptose 6-epimerase [Bacteroidales bacterium]